MALAPMVQRPVPDNAFKPWANSDLFHQLYVWRKGPIVRLRYHVDTFSVFICNYECIIASSAAMSCSDVGNILCMCQKVHHVPKLIILNSSVIFCSEQFMRRSKICSCFIYFQKKTRHYLGTPRCTTKGTNGLEMRAQKIKICVI